MTLLRHIAALGGLFLGGCCLLMIDDGSGGGSPDAGVSVDAGPLVCEDRPGVVESLRCPRGVHRPGERVSVTVSHAVAACCAGGTAHLDTTVEADGSFAITSRWEEVCGCCEECECVGPTQTRAIAIGPLAAGANVVRAGDFECVIEASAPPVCEEVPVTVRAARVLFLDQTDDVTLRHVAPSDCGCESSRVGTPSDLRVQLCCGAECDDGPVTFEEHVRFPARERGDSSRRLGGTDQPLAVRYVSDCAALEPLGLEVELPDPSIELPHGVPHVWVGVHGEQALCCAEPLPAARSEVGPGGEIVLTLYSCVQDDCACVPDAATPFTAWHSLGSLPAGDYTVRAGAHEARFSVP